MGGWAWVGVVPVLKYRFLAWACGVLCFFFFFLPPHFSVLSVSYAFLYLSSSRPSCRAPCVAPLRSVHRAEMATGQPLLPGASEADQLVKIFKLLGTPNVAFWPGLAALPEYKVWRACGRVCGGVLMWM